MQHMHGCQGIEGSRLKGSRVMSPSTKLQSRDASAAIRAADLAEHLGRDIDPDDIATGGHDRQGDATGPTPSSRMLLAPLPTRLAMALPTCAEPAGGCARCASY